MHKVLEWKRSLVDHESWCICWERVGGHLLGREGRPGAHDPVSDCGGGNGAFAAPAWIASAASAATAAGLPPPGWRGESRC